MPVSARTSGRVAIVCATSRSSPPSQVACGVGRNGRRPRKANGSPLPTRAEKRRPSAVPSVSRRRPPDASSSSSRSAARSGSAGSPRPRATTLARPPPSRPSIVAESPSPLTTSLTVPSPPSTAATSAPPATARRVRTVACPGWVVWRTSTLCAAPRAAATRSRCRPLNRLACGLAISTTRIPLLGLLVGEQSRPQRGQGAVQQARDVHLGDAQPGGDLRLGHAAEEPQVQDAALALGQPGDQRPEGGPVL